MILPLPIRLTIATCLFRVFAWDGYVNEPANDDDRDYAA